MDNYKNNNNETDKILRPVLVSPVSCIIIGTLLNPETAVELWT